MEITIKDKKIGGGNPVFIVAELSANHLQDYTLAVKTIKAAKKAGADAIKLQTYTPDTITIDSDKDYFKIDHGLWGGKTLYQLYKEAYTPWEWQPKLKKVADKLGLILFSTPFDRTAVDFLEKMDIPCYKVASFEIMDTPLVSYIASKKKPVILSTGISTINDINEAVCACRDSGNKDIIVLKCTSEYPAKMDDINLKTIPDMEKRFRVIVGLSDHTIGISVPVASVVLGAKVIEKHFILKRSLGGPDAAFSLEPKEFRTMVDSVRDAEKAMGKVTYDLPEDVKRNIRFSRSIFAVADINKGEIFTEENIRSIRPGYGLPPKNLPSILGKKAKTNIEKGTPLKFDMVA